MYIDVDILIRLGVINRFGRADNGKRGLYLFLDILVCTVFGERIFLVNRFVAVGYIAPVSAVFAA